MFASAEASSALPTPAMRRCANELAKRNVVQRMRKARVLWEWTESVYSALR
jgi:hypothetical protein